MSTCQVDSCSCRQIVPMRENIELCIGCNHPISIYLSQTDDDIQIIQEWNGKLYYWKNQLYTKTMLDK